MPRFRLLRHLRRTGKRSRLTIPLTAWIGGLLISLAVFLTLRSYNNQILRHDFQTASQDRVELLQQKIMRSTEVLFAMKSLFTSNPAVTRAQFAAFTQSALARQPEVKALEWVPRIPHDQRESLESATRAEGYSHFQFNQKDDANKLTRAGIASEYYPVLFVEPPTSNEPAFGYDLASSPIRYEALTRARDTGLPAATAPVVLAQEAANLPGATGFLVLLPVYNPPASDPTSTEEPITVQDRRARIKGFVLAVFRINDLLGPTITDFASSGIHARVEDLESAALIYPAALPANSAAATSTLEEKIPLNVGNRAWLIRLQPSPAFTSRALNPGRYTCWAALSAGIILSTILGLYLLASLHRTTWMERHVSRRTSQLSSEILVRKHAESQARAAEAQARAAALQYRSIFENAVEGIFQTSIQGRYIAANRSLAKIYGYPSPQALIDALSSISDQLYVDPSRRAAFASAVQQHGELHDFESQVYRRDGSIIWISENARTVRNDTGQILYYEGTVVDITQRKAAEDSLRQSQILLEARVHERTAELHSANALLTSEIEVRKAAEARAEAASSAKSTFLASMSHEIRTPMNAILGYAQVLSKDASLQPSHRKAVDTILSSGRHLIGVINEILDLAKIESGRTELTLEPTNIPELARSVEAMFLHRCEQKNIALHFQFLAHTSHNPHQLLLADSRKLRQVLINLVGNAVKFTDTGSVSLALTQLTPTSFQFAITDTGPGIPEDILDYIFEPFCQGRAGNLHGGTGLGLTIAKQLLQLMHAPLTVQSTLGHGTTFSFTLHLEPATLQSELPFPPHESEPLPTLHLDLPAHLRQSLAHAIALQSPTEIRRLLETLDPTSPETHTLTHTIHHHLKTYNFPALTHLLKEQKEEPAPA